MMRIPLIEATIGSLMLRSPTRKEKESSFRLIDKHVPFPEAIHASPARPTPKQRLPGNEPDLPPDVGRASRLSSSTRAERDEKAHASSIPHPPAIPPFHPSYRRSIAVSLGHSTRIRISEHATDTELTETEEDKMSALPVSMGGSDEALKEELETLRILRASLESMKQLVQEVQKDVETATGNYDGVAELSKRWQTAMSKATELDAHEANLKS